MLVGGKFIFINIPRCASTSFKLSCVNLNISTVSYEEDDKHFDFKRNIKAQLHEKITHLTKKFGNDYPIISIKRDEHDRFISSWKYFLLQLEKEYNIKESILYELKKLTIKEILFFYKNSDEYNLLNNLDINKIGSIFLNRYKIFNFDILNLYTTLFLPSSYYHNNDDRIIWFDFKNLQNIEKWVSNILGVNFYMSHTNETSDIECTLVNDNDYKNIYDVVYMKYNTVKNKTTLI